MPEEKILIRCLSCGVKNRLPRERFQHNPVCGRCHAPLDDMIIRCLTCGKKNRVPEERVHEKLRCGKCSSPLLFVGNQEQIIAVSDENFAREVLTGGAVLVDCWAPWCDPCKAIAPILDELAAQYLGAIKICKLNVDENPITASRYMIRSIPTILFFRDSSLQSSLAGLRTKAELERHILSIIQSN